MKTPNSTTLHATRMVDGVFAALKRCTLGLLLCLPSSGLTAAESGRVKLVRAPDGGIQPQAVVDSQGVVHLIAWHASKPGNPNGEAGRAVFVAHSTDDGKTFAREKPAIQKPTGACGCCGMKAFADSRGNLLALHRAASEMVNHQSGNATPEKGRVDGVPVWSLVTAFAKPDGTFIIIY